MIRALPAKHIWFLHQISSFPFTNDIAVLVQTIGMVVTTPLMPSSPRRYQSICKTILSNTICFSNKHRT